MTDCMLVMCTCPDPASSTAIATALIEDRLAACVSRLPGIQSMYRWEDRVENDEEILLLIKTSANRFAQIERRILDLHPHELPEIVAVPLSAGSAAYLDWIRSATE